MSATDPPAVAKIVRYTGRVQGVGFRATARSIAASFAVAGRIRNCSDGSVELHVEGAPAEVERFLKTVRDHWRGYIDDEQIEARDVTGNWRGFDIAG